MNERTRPNSYLNAPSRARHAAHQTQSTGSAANPNPSAHARHGNPLRSQLTRRPTGSSATATESLRRQGIGMLSDDSEIVVRDQHGEVEMGDPPSPALPEDDEDDELAMERQQESQRERQELTERLRIHRVNRAAMRDQTEADLLDVVKMSLRAKVTALADDNWMFEAEEQTRNP